MTLSLFLLGSLCAWFQFCLSCQKFAQTSVDSRLSIYTYGLGLKTVGNSVYLVRTYQLLDLILGCGVGKIRTSQRCPHLNPQNLWKHALDGKRGFAQVFPVKDPETGRETCLTQVVSIQSHESLKAEYLSQLWSEGDVTMEGRRGATLLAKERSQPLEAAESKEAISPRASGREPGPADPGFTPGRPVSDSWPSEW